MFVVLKDTFLKIWLRLLMLLLLIHFRVKHWLRSIPTLIVVIQCLQLKLQLIMQLRYRDWRRLVAVRERKRIWIFLQCQLISPRKNLQLSPIRLLLISVLAVRLLSVILLLNLLSLLRRMIASFKFILMMLRMVLRKRRMTLRIWDILLSSILMLRSV